MQIATHNGLGIYVNEMQRSINGLGHYPHAQAGGMYDSRMTPYGYWRPYHPSDARGQFGAVTPAAPTLEQLDARVKDLERSRKVGVFFTVATTFAIVALGFTKATRTRRGR